MPLEEDIGEELVNGGLRSAGARDFGKRFAGIHGDSRNQLKGTLTRKMDMMR